MRKALAILLLAVSTVSCGTGKAAGKEGRAASSRTVRTSLRSSSRIDTVKVNAAVTAERIIADARTHLGKPYRYGSPGPSSFDCSGFTSYVYRPYGYELSRSSKGQGDDGRKIKTGNLRNLQKGDLVLFGGRKNKTTIGHVGIFIEMKGEDDFYFIHASNRGVNVSHLGESYYTDRFLGARRILPDFDSLTKEEIEAIDDELRRLRLSESGLRPAEPQEAAPIESVSDNSSETLIPEEIASSAPARYHTVQDGDTLESIAEKRKTTVGEICRLNEGLSKDSELKKGTRIRVR